MSSPVDLAVVGQDPGFAGGALAQMQAFLAGARSLGRSPELVYVPHPTFARRRITPDRLEVVRQLRGAHRLAPGLREPRSVWVAATLATHGLAAARSGRPYGCWIGTSLDAEWDARAGGLDRARRLVHGANAPILRRIERQVLIRARRVYATSPSARAEVAAAGGIDERDVLVLPIPVDTDHLTPEPNATWSARLETPQLVFVGRADDPRKNVGLLLSAFGDLRRAMPHVTLVLVGRPPIGTLPPGVQSAAEVDDVVDTLRRATILVVPSLQEGFGIVAAEALACGVPVLSTPCGGPEELIRASGGGVVLSGFTAAEMADEIVRLLRDHDALNRMRVAGRHYVEQVHSREAFRKRLDEAMRAVDEPA